MSRRLKPLLDRNASGVWLDELREQAERNQVVDSPDIRIERSERGTALYVNGRGRQSPVVNVAAALDHAVFAENYDGAGSNAIFGVGNSQVHRCDPETGVLQVAARSFGVGNFSPQWIAWSAVNKKLYVTGGIQFNGWDQNAAANYFQGMGLYEIDPGTLAAKGPYNPFDFYTSDEANTVDTALGPLIYYPGDSKIYGIFSGSGGDRWYLYKFNPSTNEFEDNSFTSTEPPFIVGSSPAELNFTTTSPPEWVELFLDGDDLWVSNNFAGSLGFPNTIERFNLDDDVNTWWGYAFQGSTTEVDVDLFWSPLLSTGFLQPSIGIGRLGEPLKPGTDVVIDYVEGGMRYTIVNIGWTLNLNDVDRNWRFTSEKTNVTTVLPETIVGYETVEELQAADAGLNLTVAADGTGDYGFFYLNAAFNDSFANSTPRLKFRIRYTKLVGANSDSFFGMVRVGGNFYLVPTFSSIIAKLDLTDTDPEAAEVADYTKIPYNNGENPSPTPHKMVYVEATDRIYIPTLRGNTVVIFNPNTDTVEEIKTGFDQPFHIVATDKAIWAVQRSSPGLKKIADIPEEEED